MKVNLVKLQRDGVSRLKRMISTSQKRSPYAGVPRVKCMRCYASRCSCHLNQVRYAEAYGYEEAYVILDQRYHERTRRQYASLIESFKNGGKS